MTDLLLSYHLDIAQGVRSGGYDVMRLSVDADTPKYCRRIVLTVPFGDHRAAPLSVHSSATTVTGRKQGRQWWISPTATDPAVVAVTFVPETIARFDGTWSITFTVALDRSVDQNADITEEAGADVHTISSRASSIVMAGRDPS